MRVRVEGLEEAIRTVVELEGRASDFTDAFGEINATILQPMFRRRFASEGSFPDGGKWDPLAPATVQRRTSRPGGNRGGILVDFGDLQASLEKQGPESVVVIEEQKMERGTSRPGATAHQKGAGVPQRQIIPDPMPQRIVNEIQDVLFAHMGVDRVG